MLICDESKTKRKNIAELINLRKGNDVCFFYIIGNVIFYNVKNNIY